MLTNSIFHQVFSPQTILAARTVASQTVLYGGVILKATQSAMLVVSLFSFPPNLISPLCFAMLSDHFFGGLELDTCLPDATSKSHNLISILTLFKI